MSTEENAALLATYLKGPEDGVWDRARLELERRGFDLAQADQALDYLVRELARGVKEGTAAPRFTPLSDQGFIPEQQN